MRQPAYPQRDRPLVQNVRRQGQRLPAFAGGSMAGQTQPEQGGQPQPEPDPLVLDRQRDRLTPPGGDQQGEGEDRREAKRRQAQPPAAGQRPERSTQLRPDHPRGWRHRCEQRLGERGNQRDAGPDQDRAGPPSRRLETAARPKAGPARDEPGETEPPGNQSGAEEGQPAACHRPRAGRLPLRRCRPWCSTAADAEGVGARQRVAVNRRPHRPHHGVGPLARVDHLGPHQAGIDLVDFDVPQRDLASVLTDEPQRRRADAERHRLAEAQLQP